MWLRRSLLFTVFLAPGALPALAADRRFRRHGRHWRRPEDVPRVPRNRIAHRLHCARREGRRRRMDERLARLRLMSRSSRGSAAYDRRGYCRWPATAPAAATRCRCRSRFADVAVSRDLHALVQCRRDRYSPSRNRRALPRGARSSALYATTYPRDVDGMVLVDGPFRSPGGRRRRLGGVGVAEIRFSESDMTEALKIYPDIERVDADASFDQMLAAPPLQPMPLVVLSADIARWGPLVPGMIADGLFTPDTPPDVGYVT